MKKLTDDWEFSQKNAEWIREISDLIIGHDTHFFEKSLEMRQNAYDLSLEYEYLWQNITENEQTVILAKIVSYLNLAREYLLSTYANKIYYYATHLNQTESVRIFHQEHPPYYNLSIEIDPNSQYYADVFNPLNTSQFLDLLYIEVPGSTSVAYYSITVPSFLENTTNEIKLRYGDHTFYLIDFGVLSGILHWETYYKSKEADELLILTVKYSQLTELFKTIVPLISVATVLSAAMASRLDEKKLNHQLSIVRSDILKDKEVIIPAKDKLANGILILALLLAIGALLIPIL